MTTKSNACLMIALGALLLFAAPAVAEEVPAAVPDTTITIVSIGATEANFVLSASVPGSNFEYRVDASEWKPTSPELRFTDYDGGAHVLEARAITGDGQSDPTPARQEFSISGVPFRPNEQLDPPALSKFEAKGKLLKFSSRGYGAVEFTIEECGWRGLLRSCKPFSKGRRNVDTGRFTVATARRFHRGKKYRIRSLSTSDTGPFETTSRTVTAK